MKHLSYYLTTSRFPQWELYMDMCLEAQKERENGIENGFEMFPIPFLWGSGGIGKTAYIIQWAKEKGFEVYVFTANVKTEDSLTGKYEVITSKDGKQHTVARPFLPVWNEQSGIYHGLPFEHSTNKDKIPFLLLDEPNRVHQDYMNKLLQVAYFKEVEGNLLDPRTIITLSGNPTEVSDTSFNRVTELDQAMFDRVVNFMATPNATQGETYHVERFPNAKIRSDRLNRGNHNVIYSKLRQQITESEPFVTDRRFTECYSQIEDILFRTYQKADTRDMVDVGGQRLTERGLIVSMLSSIFMTRDGGDWITDIERELNSSNISIDQFFNMKADEIENKISTISFRWYIEQILRQYLKDNKNETLNKIVKCFKKMKDNKSYINYGIRAFRSYIHNYPDEIMNVLEYIDDIIKKDVSLYKEATYAIVNMIKMKNKAKQSMETEV